MVLESLRSVDRKASDNESIENKSVRSYTKESL